MACCGRPDKPKLQRMNRTPSAGRTPEPLLPQEGMTLIQFNGRGTSARPIYGQSGSRYLFGGKKHLTAYVLDSDVPALLKITENGKHLYTVAPVPEKIKQAAATVLPVIAPIEIIETVAVEEEIPAETPAEIDPTVTIRPKRTRTKKAE